MTRGTSETGECYVAQIATGSMKTSRARHLEIRDTFEELYTQLQASVEKKPTDKYARRVAILVIVQ